MEREQCDFPYFRFKDLLVRSTPEENIRTLATNPCDWEQSIPEQIPVFKHERPALSWSGLLWNPPPRAKVSLFNNEGNPFDPELEQQEAPVAGHNFPGFTSIPGFVYEGLSFPEAYQGRFFQADLSGWIRTLQFDENWKVTAVDTFALWDDKGIVHLAQNPSNGTIYWTHIYANEVHKISYGGNPAPVAKPQADRYYGASPLEVHFDGSNSFDPDGGQITFFWDFGDGDTSHLARPKHTFSAMDNTPATFEVTLTVMDSAGQQHQQSMMVSLNNTPPKVRITSFNNGDQFPLTGQTYLPLNAEVSDAEHPDNQLDYTWQVFLHHNTHYHPENPIREVSPKVILDPVGCNSEVYWYRIKLTVTDANGLSASDEGELFPYCGEPIVNIQHFTGIADIDYIQLDWQITSIPGVNNYEVQRTTDYRFETIGSVSSSLGNLNNTFQYKDFSPPHGVYYYRLKINQDNGLYDYSEVVRVKYPPKLSYFVHPNPAKDWVTVWIEHPVSPEVQFILFNSLGQKVYDTSWQTTDGPIEQQVYVGNWSNGTYFYRLHDGDRKVFRSLIIAK